MTVAVAVVPAQRRIWFAARGRGAFTADLEDSQAVRRRPLSVGQPPSEFGRCRVGILPPLPLMPTAYRPQVDRLMAHAVVDDWSVHAALLVASGELDIAVQVGGKVWDYAPLSLIVQEAGGAFSDTAGQGHPVTGTAVFACNDQIRIAACTALNGQ